MNTKIKNFMRNEENWCLMASVLCIFVCTVVLVAANSLNKSVVVKEVEPAGEIGVADGVSDASVSPEKAVEPEFVVLADTEVTVKKETAEEVVEPEETVVEIPVEVEVIEDETVAESEPAVVYFDVPLSEELQDHIFALCEEYGVEPELIISMIKKESGFDPAAWGDNGRSYGLMQIQKQYFGEQMKEFGVTDLFDPFQNVRIGIDYIAELIGAGRGLEWALMCYNGGHAYANSMASSGWVSDYANVVMAYAEELKGVN